MTHINVHRRGVATSSEAVVDRPAASAVLGQVLTLISAAALLISGAMALARAGVSNDLATPVVSVFGYSHTAWLGIIELAFGVLLLAAGVSQASRGLAAALGVLMIVAAVLILADTSMPKELAIEHGYGSFVLLFGVLALIGGILPGGWTRRWARADDL